MRLITISAALVLAVVFTLSCTTTGTVSDQSFFYEPKTVVWQAAVRAMQDIGAKILASSENAGMLSGALNIVELGGRVRIDVSVRPSGGGSQAMNEGTDLSVSVVLEGVENDDPQLREDLAKIRDEYLEATEYHARALQSRSPR